MKQNGGDTLNHLLAAGTLAVLLATVCMLGWVASRYNSDMQQAMNEVARSFEKSNVLKESDDLHVNFSVIEDLVYRAETSQSIRKVYVAKRLTDAEKPRWVLLHPFQYAATHPKWQRDLSGLIRHEIVQGQSVVGVIYIDLDKSVLRGVQATIGFVSLLIVLTLLALINRIYKQQRVLSITTEIIDQNQRELIRMERLALAGQLTANIFHDIRKPVTNIKHELSDLSEALGAFAGATRALKNMRDQTELFFDILRDLNLERFVRSDTSEEEFVDVNRVLEQSLKLVQYERGSTQLNVDYTTDLPLVLAYPYRLVQVFSNIILNAYQALEGRGELHLHTAMHAENPFEIIVVIEDNGPGIDDKDLPDVFSPFHTTKSHDKGTGLGLYICKTIVEQAGGSIEARSDSGTSIIVTLPAGD